MIFPQIETGVKFQAPPPPPPCSLPSNKTLRVYPYHGCESTISICLSSPIPITPPQYIAAPTHVNKLPPDPIFQRYFRRPRGRFLPSLLSVCFAAAAASAAEAAAGSRGNADGKGGSSSSEVAEEEERGERRGDISVASRVGESALSLYYRERDRARACLPTVSLPFPLLPPFNARNHT